MITYFWIGLGSALGGVARYACSSLIAHWLGESFPWGTLLVNVLGSFVIGFFATVTGPEGRFLATSGTRLFVMVGICGGYTTFSSFSLQTFALIREGDLGRAGANVLASVVFCMLSVWLGAACAGYLNQMKTA
jgi:fluoride exporter